MSSATVTSDARTPMWVFRSAVPKTLPVNFASYFRRLDPPSVQTLTVLTNSRNSLIRSLESDSTDACISLIETSYLPSLLAILRLSETVSPELSTPLVFSWFTPYTVRFSSSSPSTAPSLRFEHLMLVTCLAFLYRKKASETIEASDLKVCANRLCRASGIFDWLSRQPLSAWSCGLKMAETAPEFHSAWASVCLLESQELAIRKARESEMSDAVMARLSREVYRRAFEAERVFSALAGTGGSEVRLTYLSQYLNITACVFRGWMHKSLAVAADREGKKGLAVAHIQHAVPTPQEEKLMGDRKVRESLTNFLASVTPALEENKAMCQRLRAENDRVCYEVVPNDDSPEMKLPEPACTAKVVPFVEPEANTSQFQVSFTNPSSCSVQ